MFAPDGYVPLSEINDVFWNIAEDKFPRPDPWDIFGADIRARVYSELLFSRFVEEHMNEMWVFQYPNLTLRAWPGAFNRTNIYRGPCPTDSAEAEDVWEHLKTGPRLFLTKSMRVNANISGDVIDLWGLEEAVEAAKPLQGALACWKPADRPSDLERAVYLFVTKSISETIRISGIWLACPQTRRASGQLGKLSVKSVQTARTPPA